jgi:hypothetical protein
MCHPRPRGARRMLRALPLVVIALLLGVAMAAVPALGQTASTTTTTTTTTTSPPALPVPANGSRLTPQVISALPAAVTGTTAGVTAPDPTDPPSCAPIAGGVWFSVTAPTTPSSADTTTGSKAAAPTSTAPSTQVPETIGLLLTAAGNLDAVVDVFLVQRSQLTAVTCQLTGTSGKAEFTFSGTEGDTYLIRVAQRSDSVAGAFSLDVLLPQKPAAPPGSRLPAAGVTGTVDKIKVTSVAYSVALHAGTSYRMNLVDRTPGACVSAAFYAPGTTDFSDVSPLFHLYCGGYHVYTPAAGAGGVYSFLVTANINAVGPQHFHLQLGQVGPLDTAPGVFLENYSHVSGHLDGRGIAVVNVYSFDVTARSNLDLTLSAAASSTFDLALIGEDGKQIACGCGGSGPEAIAQKTLPRGRYYAAVTAREDAVGTYSIERVSRTITTTAIQFGTGTEGERVSPPGRTVSLQVKVTPRADGPVTVTIERFDPVAGWQFARTETAQVSRGVALVPFSPSSSGRWRVSASYLGDRVSSPSQTGLVDLLVSGPLRE